MIRTLAGAGIIASGAVLAWYQTLSKSERKVADGAAMDAVRHLFSLAAEHQSGSQANPLTHLANRLFTNRQQSSE